jgi:two-component system, NarL family, nitrate/nitrite response regulator NarL
MLERKPGMTDLAAKLFLVDDSDIFLRVLTRFLNRQPQYRIVGTARSGIEAVAHAAAVHPDIILLDLAMPGMSGLEAIPLLREQLPDARIIVLTLLEPDTYAALVRSAGADAFVEKEYLNEMLLPMIRRLWHQSGEQAV